MTKVGCAVKPLILAIANWVIWSVASVDAIHAEELLDEAARKVLLVRVTATWHSKLVKPLID